MKELHKIQVVRKIVKVEEPSGKGLDKQDKVKPDRR